MGPILLCCSRATLVHYVLLCIRFSRTLWFRENPVHKSNEKSPRNHIFVHCLFRSTMIILCIVYNILYMLRTVRGAQIRLLLPYT